MECIVHDDVRIDVVNALQNALPERNHRKLPENEPSQLDFVVVLDTLLT
jgi:hypothetical protein